MRGVSADIIGPAVIISGDTIGIEGTQIRLLGADAPALAQTCVASKIEWRCGIVSKLKLARRIGEGRVVCQLHGTDKYERTLGTCHLEGSTEPNLGRWLVRDGWALAATHGEAPYLADEARASSDGAGLWRGGFVPSSQWRGFAEFAEDSPGDERLGCSSCTLRHQAAADRKRDRSPDPSVQ